MDGEPPATMLQWIYGPGPCRRQCQPGGNPVLVVSDILWNRVLNADPHVIGQVITLNGVGFTIIGIAPEKFTGTGLSEAVPDF